MTPEPPIPLPLTIAGARARLFLSGFRRWAEARPDVVAAAVLGSWATGRARPDSDLDILIIANDIAGYLAWLNWPVELGKAVLVSREEDNPLPAIRVLYNDGPEVEYLLATPVWLRNDLAEPRPDWLRPGLCQIVHDPERLLNDALNKALISPND